MNRCWPHEPDSVLRIHGLSYDKRFDLFDAGTRSIKNLPATYKLNAVQQRQRRSWATGALVLEPTVAEELVPYQGRLGFLDFESVARAVPVWAGTRPWEQIGVQFSYHEGRSADRTRTGSSWPSPARTRGRPSRSASWRSRATRTAS